MLCIIHETIDYISYILYIPFSMPYILYIYMTEKTNQWRKDELWIVQNTIFENWLFRKCKVRFTLHQALNKILD